MATRLGMGVWWGWGMEGAGGDSLLTGGEINEL